MLKRKKIRDGVIILTLKKSHAVQFKYVQEATDGTMKDAEIFGWVAHHQLFSVLLSPDIDCQPKEHPDKLILIYTNAQFMWVPSVDSDCGYQIILT